MDGNDEVGRVKHGDLRRPGLLKLIVDIPKVKSTICIHLHPFGQSMVDISVVSGVSISRKTIEYLYIGFNLWYLTIVFFPAFVDPLEHNHPHPSAPVPTGCHRRASST